MKSKILITALLLISIPSFAQSYVPFQFDFSSQKETYERMSEALEKLSKEISQTEKDLDELSESIIEVLSGPTDIILRDQLKKDYEDIQALYSKLDISGYSDVLKKYKEYKLRVRKHMLDYTERINNQAGNDEGNNINAKSWSGSGFALDNGYFVTNFHVVENAKKILIYGINGDFSSPFVASIVATDKFNDIAILKINDSRFAGFGKIPYSIKASTSEVGEDVYVLGYPLTATMGEEIKYTTGVISSKTGYQGNVSLYQISAPIQPGNSGGPLFDTKGNIIGIVNSKHTGAEGVGYAIKTVCLYNLVESAISSKIIPSSNQIASSPRPDQIKAIKNFVFLVNCSN